MALHPLHLKSNGYPAVRRSSAETTLFLQQLGGHAPLGCARGGVSLSNPTGGEPAP